MNYLKFKKIKHCNIIINSIFLFFNLTLLWINQLTDNFRILSNITSGGTWKSNTKYWEEKRVSGDIDQSTLSISPYQAFAKLLIDAISCHGCSLRCSRGSWSILSLRCTFYLLQSPHRPLDPYSAQSAAWLQPLSHWSGIKWLVQILTDWWHTWKLRWTKCNNDDMFHNCWSQIHHHALE